MRVVICKDCYREEKCVGSNNWNKEEKLRRRSLKIGVDVVKGKVRRVLLFYKLEYIILEFIVLIVRGIRMLVNIEIIQCYTTDVIKIAPIIIQFLDMLLLRVILRALGVIQV